MKKNKNLQDIVDKYLDKKGHDKVLTIYLDNYNGNKIYIRYDYVADIMVYKVTWVDFNFFKEKKIEKYINTQMVTKILATRMADIITKISIPSGEVYNDSIIGDRVTIINYESKEKGVYVFDRFLPLEWKVFIDPLAIIFSYLPRSMECFLTEIFGKLDGLEDKFNALKPYKFDIIKDDLTKIFKPAIIARGTKYFEEDRVSFLEKVNDKYIAIVEGSYPYLVIVHMVDKEHVILWCNCKYEGYCKHIYAVILAIRKKKFKNFYKVINSHANASLLDKVTDGSFNLCFGVENDNLLLISNEGAISSVPIMKDGKCSFKVLEDDDELSLSKILDKYKR